MPKGVIYARQAILTPTVAKLLDPSEVPSFETLIVGGEPLTSDVIARWSPGHPIINVYGPTETSMVITTKEVDPNGRPGNIDAPFPPVMAFILHPEGTTLVPHGSVGELCVGGPQVTDGYVNREGLTKAAFMENVLGTDRMYRTGDLARWLPGSEIECLGQKGNQVKIHRTELSEIEQVILKTGLVQGAAVLTVNLNSKKQHVAFCIFAAGSCEIQKAEEYQTHARDWDRVQTTRHLVQGAGSPDVWHWKEG
jgi:non-ribosomal peptide synthetase component F